MSPWWRKTYLTAHVMTSVGWLGAVAAFLALALVGTRNADTQIVRSAYIATDSITWLVIGPLAFASLATGLVPTLLGGGQVDSLGARDDVVAGPHATDWDARHRSAIRGDERRGDWLHAVPTRDRRRRRNRRALGERRVVGIQTAGDNRIWLEKESR